MSRRRNSASSTSLSVEDSISSSVVLISICYNQIHQLPIRHWHLVETFLFFVFMVIAPESINELDAEQMTQDDLNQMSESQNQ